MFLDQILLVHKNWGYHIYLIFLYYYLIFLDKMYNLLLDLSFYHQLHLLILFWLSPHSYSYSDFSMMTTLMNQLMNQILYQIDQLYY